MTQRLLQYSIVSSLSILSATVNMHPMPGSMTIAVSQERQDALFAYSSLTSAVRNVAVCRVLPPSMSPPGFDRKDDESIAFCCDESERLSGGRRSHRSVNHLRNSGARLMFYSAGDASRCHLASQQTIYTCFSTQRLLVFVRRPMTLRRQCLPTFRRDTR